MPATWRARRRLTGTAHVGLLALPLALLLAVLAALAAAPADAAPSPTPAYVKYYVVAVAYQGQPETLSEIAGRFLGNTSRAGEIFSRNAGIRQADGGTLTDPGALHAGWVLLLPWDAVGPEVRYGIPPTTVPAPSPATTTPALPPTPAPGPAATQTCAGTPKNDADSQGQWGILRVAPEHAWVYSRGRGVLVAVIDSGIDATRPELAGHVAAGADITGGTGRADTDCLGSGTAMAGIVAAGAGTSTGVGMAPDATVLPVRVTPVNGSVSEANQVGALGAAVAAGARVVLLGAYLDPSLPAVARAIDAAVAHDAVVVVPASTGAAAPGGAGLLRAGAIGIDGRIGFPYPSGAVDVVAPGIDVASLGIAGTGQIRCTGTQYAAAFVAGEVALVRAMYPDLDAAQVVRRVEATADRIGQSAPDATFGWGLIDPGAAVTHAIPDENRTPEAVGAAHSAGIWSTDRTRALLVTAAIVLILVLLLVLRARRMVRTLAPSTTGTAATILATVELPAAVTEAARESPVDGAWEVADERRPDTERAERATPDTLGEPGARERSEKTTQSARAAGRPGPAPTRSGASTAPPPTQVREGAPPEPSADDGLAPAGWWRHGPGTDER